MTETDGETHALMRAEPVGQTLVERLADHAGCRGATPAFSFLHRGETLADGVDFAGLDAAARSVARCLVQAGLQGQPVLLALPSNLDFVRCFLGCLYAGAYAVPAPPLEGRRGLERSQAIMQDLGSAGIIVSARSAAQQILAAPNVGKCVVLTAEEALSTVPAEARPAPAADAIAFIQYTSGSLGKPRGVVVTHRNIMANQAMIQEAFEHTTDDMMASWLPLHHDMGLIGSVLQSIYVGMHSVLMPPLAFLQKPERWLRAISGHGATVAGAPNFAFDLCSRQIGGSVPCDIDLSGWRLAFCGAEPVRARTLRTFAAAFASTGFSERALMPVYGLAEATLFVSGGKAGDGFRTHHFATEAVSCGRAPGGSHIRIVNRDGACLPDGGTGEICIGGAHVSPGYWSSATRSARRDKDRLVELEGLAFFRTGDIGSIREGDLFVLGRSRDIVIIRGQKIHAEDVEATVLGSQLPVQLTAAAAFAVDNGASESLVVVCEVRRLSSSQDTVLQDLPERLKAAVGEAHGVLPHEILFVASGAIPRTSSGKMRRAACRELYATGLLQAVKPEGAASRGAA